MVSAPDAQTASPTVSVAQLKQANKDQHASPVVAPSQSPAGNGKPTPSSPETLNGHQATDDAAVKEQVNPDPLNPNLPPAEVAKTIPCRFFPLGKCKYGDACAFAHVITEEALAQAEAHKRASEVIQGAQQNGQMVQHQPMPIFNPSASVHPTMMNGAQSSNGMPVFDPNMIYYASPPLNHHGQDGPSHPSQQDYYASHYAPPAHYYYGPPPSSQGQHAYPGYPMFAPPQMYAHDPNGNMAPQHYAAQFSALPSAVPTNASQPSPAATAAPLSDSLRSTSTSPLPNGHSLPARPSSTASTKDAGERTTADASQATTESSQAGGDSTVATSPATTNGHFAPPAMNHVQYGYGPPQAYYANGLPASSEAYDASREAQRHERSHSAQSYKQNGSYGQQSQYTGSARSGSVPSHSRQQSGPGLHAPAPGVHSRRPGNLGSMPPTVAGPGPAAAHTQLKPFRTGKFAGADPSFKSSRPCTFWGDNRCRNGDECPFGHPLADGSGDARQLHRDLCGVDGTTLSELLVREKDRGSFARRGGYAGSANGRFAPNAAAQTAAFPKYNNGASHRPDEVAREKVERLLNSTRQSNALNGTRRPPMTNGSSSQSNGFSGATARSGSRAPLSQRVPSGEQDFPALPATAISPQAKSPTPKAAPLPAEKPKETSDEAAAESAAANHDIPQKPVDAPVTSQDASEAAASVETGPQPAPSPPAAPAKLAFSFAAAAARPAAAQPPKVKVKSSSNESKTATNVVEQKSAVAEPAISPSRSAAALPATVKA
ncbi:uncharacterized protein L969DRAFT_69644 [Mixia osmundae IAM 14324]|uniref:C3H1-type domain-containing protein n=1 Tax=Mixia osmundae (strain CBS 9802 / IAM 14324 / JCM 22182 / KY 12970) TaxID=764103 RepID=G7E314_MIXOS|nr:uncharacterized protein L969DRAFT_69644 [Mixia osmundae IAM 14324]KEI42516.1 hypothetical protein L969DRAFT_69644 [Mixia osmundae IAM 14324]GAA97195.1 hypothetical protein E5Q_03871 [Mixia osmundae IAM 14324]